MKRRDFLIQTGLATAGGMAAGVFGATTSAQAPRVPGLMPTGKNVVILYDPRDPVASSKPAQWAIEQLRAALAQHGLEVRVVKSLDEVPPNSRRVVAAGPKSIFLGSGSGSAIPPPNEPEALALSYGGLDGPIALFACGADARGLMYALTEIADAATLGDPYEALQLNQYVVERPANRVRSVMRMVASDVEDKAWYHDRDFWRGYLSLLAAQRFNRINLAFGLSYDAPSGLRDTYLYFAYPFLLPVPGYNVRATNLPDAERDLNLEMLRFISDEAAARGLLFQLGLWTHAYEWIRSPNANHVITGLTPQTQAPYSRDALAIILKECPNITGVTFRIHGESGVPEGSYDLWKTIFDGCVRSGRPIELDMHAKGMDQPTIDAALGTGLPVTISPKYWAEHLGLPYHQAAIRAKELPVRRQGGGPYAQSSGARSFLRYGYGDLLTEDRKYGIFHRTWPGTQRVLLWGDPAFAAAYGRSGNFCGSLGHEIFDPLSFKGRKGSGLPGFRDGYADASLRAPGGDFEKYRYTFRLWGRHLYNPDTQPEVWQRQLRQDYGPAAGPAEIALANASRILPLITTAHLPAAANYNYWPEMYVNMSIVDSARVDTLRPSYPYGPSETPSPRRFGTVSPLDPQLFSRIDDHADELLSGSVSGKYTPVEVAQWLEDFSKNAAENLAQARAQAKDRNTPVFRRFAIDVEVQSGLGRFFGQKFRAAALYALYSRTGNRAALDAALTSYRSARSAWARIAEVTNGVYVADLTYGEAWFQRGHWTDRIAAIDADIAAMEQMANAPAPQPALEITPEKFAALISEILGRPQRAAAGVTHAQPASFHRAQPVVLALAPGSGGALPKEAKLHYRHTQQAESWNVLPMQSQAGGYSATIPGDYTNSPYPLTYYFELGDQSGRQSLYPGFAASLTNQPYFVLRQAG